MKKIHITISGKVQGVGFRYWLYKNSNKRNVYGWVKNKITGEVEAVLIGNCKNVDEILKLCKTGPLSSKVTNIKTQNYKQEYFKKSFNILSENEKR